MLGFHPRTARIVWTAALLIVLFYALYLSATAIAVVIFAIFFSYIVTPLVDLLQRKLPRRVPRIVPIAIAFLFVFLVAGTAVTLFGTQIEDEATALTQNFPTQITAEQVSNKIPLPDFIEPMRHRILNFVRARIAAGTDQAMPLAQKFGTGLMHAAGGLIYVVIVPILSFFMVREAPRLRRDFLALLEPADCTFWSGVIEDMDIVVSKYVRALVLLSLVALFAYGIAFTLLGVPYALLLAGLSALLEFIPFAGPLAAVIVTLVIALLSAHQHILWLAIFFLVFRLFQDYILNPLLMNEEVAVRPMFVIIGLLAGEELGGVLGIFLAVPIMAAIKVFALRIMAAREAAVSGPP